MILDENGIWKGDDEEVAYPEEGNAHCYHMEQKSFWFQHRNNVIYEVIKKHPFKGNFADIGGGNGYQVSFLSENITDCKLFLIEPGYQGCLNAVKSGVENVYNTKFAEFPFEKFNVTGVGLFDVIEHIEDDINFLRLLKQKCQRKTKIFITVPAHSWLWSDVDEYAKHYRRYARRSLRKLAENAGLEMIYSSYFFFYISPLTWFLRCLPYKIMGSRDDEKIVEAEMKNHSSTGVISKCFKFFNDFEIKKIKSSNLRFGASVIAVLEVN